MWQNAEPTLANFWHYWAIFDCCKWPNIVTLATSNNINPSSPARSVRKLRVRKSGFKLRLFKKIWKILIGLSLRDGPLDDDDDGLSDGKGLHGRRRDNWRGIVPQRRIIEGDVERRNSLVSVGEVRDRGRIGLGDSEKIGEIWDFWHRGNILRGIYGNGHGWGYRRGAVGTSVWVLMMVVRPTHQG